MQLSRCPVCAGKIGFGSVAKDLSDRIHIKCLEGCGDYLLFAPLEAIRAALGKVGAEGRRILSRHLRCKTEADLLAYLRPGYIIRMVNAHHAARQVIGRYGLSDPTFKDGPGGDTVSPLFYVQAAEGRFSLRVYNDEVGEHAVRSELAWLRHLRQAGDLIVPMPVAGQDGAVCQRADARDGLGPRWCVLSRWIEGDTVKRLRHEADRALTNQQIKDIGKTLARFHRSAASFEAPAWFDRPQYGAERLQKAISAPDAGEDHIEAARAMLRFARQTGTAHTVMGPVHADIADHNMLIHHGKVGLIDFMTLGWGYYWADLLKAMVQTVDPVGYSAFLQGYTETRPTPDGFADLVRALGLDGEHAGDRVRPLQAVLDPWMHP